MQLGNPSNATADTNNHSHYLIQRPIEAIDYNDSLGLANWASWDLTAGDANGAVTRQDSFAADTNLPTNFHWVGAGDYAHSGYDRGHLCPSADRTDSTNDNDMTFLMSNIMPQASDNNSGVWGNFENYCRGLAYSSNHYELLIICGPAGFDGSKINTNGYVAIPQYTWKIVVVVSPGAGLAVSRISVTNRVIAIKIPNTNGVSTAWQDFVTSASEIEVDTGLTFFTALPADVAGVLRSKVDGQTNPPPAIFAFSPPEGAASNHVVITGTNFSLATEVTFNGENASFHVDSSTQITAIVPEDGSSGFISVTTPSGTAVSPDIFYVEGAGTVYNGILAGWDVSGLPGGLNNFGASPLSATTNAESVVVTGLTRGAGVGVSGSGAARGWGGNGFTGADAVAAAAAGQFASFSVTVNSGYTMSFGSVSRFDYRRSGTGPAGGVLQYRAGSGGFMDITNLVYSSTSSSGGSIGAIDLSGFSDLQNVGAGTNVTFRIVNFGGGSSGTWYVFDTAKSPAPDLAVVGSITPVVSTTNTPPAPPTLSSAGFADGQFQFLLTGTAGSNYVVQAATNLAAPDWVSLMTNAAPFWFIESNANQFEQRFYRSQVAP